MGQREIKEGREFEERMAAAIQRSQSQKIRNLTQEDVDRFFAGRDMPRGALREAGPTSVDGMMRKTIIDREEGDYQRPNALRKQGVRR